VGPDLVIEGSVTGPAGWDATPLQGFFLGPNDARPRPAAAYRWHLAEPIPFAGPMRSASEPGNIDTLPAESRAAVFWYSEQAGPEPARP
jgi:hypothetical protein